MAVVEHLLPGKSSSVFSPGVVGGVAAPLRKYWVCDTQGELPVNNPPTTIVTEGDLAYVLATNQAWVYQVHGATVFWRRLDTDEVAYAEVNASQGTNGATCGPVTVFSDGVTPFLLKTHAERIDAVQSTSSVSLSLVNFTSGANLGFIGTGFGTPREPAVVERRIVLPAGFTVLGAVFGVGGGIGTITAGTGDPPNYGQKWYFRVTRC